MKEQAPTLEEAYNLYRRRVYMACRSIVRDHDAAEDLTQGVFLHIVDKLHLFRGDCRFYTWLHRVTVNYTLAWMRKKKLETVSIDQGLEGDLILLDVFAREDPSVRAIPTKLTLQTLIPQMPEGFRTVIILHHIYDLEYTEIAQILGISVGGVKSQCNKARSWLRKRL